MPIYEYVCPKCKTAFEVMRPFAEADKPAMCPHCKSEAQKENLELRLKDWLLLTVAGKTLQEEGSR